MNKYEVFGARLLVRRLQDEAAKDSQAPPPYMLPAPGMPLIKYSDSGGMAEFSKGYVVAIGKPCEPQGEQTDDPLSSSVIGGEDSDRFGFREVMREVVGMMAKMQLGATAMPPVAVGDIVIFPSFRATLLPGESDLFLVGGDLIVARVAPGDFEGTRDA